MASLLPLYIKEYYKDDPLFSNSKIVTSLYNTGFEGTLNDKFFDKIKFDNINESKFNSISNPTYTNILINAIENSDAVIKASEQLPSDLLDYLKTCDKPILDYFPISEFDSAYTNFYLTKVLS